MLLWIQVCYVAFWDNVTLATQEAEGHKIGDNGYIGKWRVVVVKDLPFMDQRLNGKIPKVYPPPSFASLTHVVLCFCLYLTH